MQCRRPRFNPWVGKGPWRREWLPTPAFVSREFYRQRSLAGCSPWDCKESDTTERLHFHFSLPCIGEGNGNPLQCSCLENPRNGGAWWAAFYGVTQSQTRLKRLSSSSSSWGCSMNFICCQHCGNCCGSENGKERNQFKIPFLRMHRA